MSDDATIFDQYAGTARAAAPLKSGATEQAEEESAYRAYGMAPTKARQTRLRLYFRDGTVGLLSYAYVMEVLCTSHQFLSLICTNCVITLEGRNLTELLDGLQDETLRWLRCFHAARDAEPAANEPVITEMKRESLQEAMG